MKKFLINSLLVTPLFIIIACINYSRDVYHIYRPDPQLKEVAEWMLSGSNVSYTRSYARVGLVNEFIQKSEEKSDWMMLGSSKSMMANKDIIGHVSFFNSSIKQARLTDYLAIVYSLDQENLLPDTLILEFSPHLFNIHQKAARHHENYDSYFAMADILDLPKLSPNRWNRFSMKTTQLFSGRNFLDALFRNPGKNFQQTDQTSLPNHRIIQSDGSESGKEYYKSQPKKRKKLILDKEVDNQHLYNEMDPTLIKHFEGLVAFLQSKNVNLIFYIPPYHPETFNITINQNPVFEEFNRYYQALSTKMKVPVFGGLDPGPLRLTDNDFIDATHTGPSGFRKVWLSRTHETK